MFSGHSHESDWEWAAKRRTLFRTPKVGVFTGIATLFVGMLVRGAFSDPNWLRASVVPALIAVTVALLLPQIETWWIWILRHRIRLDERDAELASLKAAAAPPSPPPLDKPLASPVLIADRTGWARLRITNTGAGATFSATSQAYGLTAGAVDGRRVAAKWEEVHGPTQRIGRGDTRVLRLATLTNLGAPKVFDWKLHRSDGPDIGGVDTEDLIDVTVVAEPDLAEPCQLRVVLRSEPAESELIRLPIDTAKPAPVVVEKPPMRLVLPEIVQKSLSDYPLMVELSVNGREAWVTIDSAFYGCDGDMREVREAVLKHIVDGRIELVVNNKTLGIDPCRGTPKELVVNYRVGDGPPIEVRRKEHDTLRVP
jgi:hypothetical protein